MTLPAQVRDFPFKNNALTVLPLFPGKQHPCGGWWTHESTPPIHSLYKGKRGKRGKRAQNQSVASYLGLTSKVRGQSPLSPSTQQALVLVALSLVVAVLAVAVGVR